MITIPENWKHYAGMAVIGLAASTVAASILLGATSQGRTAVRTALFLPQILPAALIKPLDLFTGEPARLTTMPRVIVPGQMRQPLVRLVLLATRQEQIGTRFKGDGL